MLKYKLRPLKTGNRLGSCGFWIWPVLIFVWFAVERHKNQQYNGADHRNKTDEEPPTTPASIM
jgi:hypothetical protein